MNIQEYLQSLINSIVEYLYEGSVNMKKLWKVEIIFRTETYNSFEDSPVEFTYISHIHYFFC